MHGKKSNFFNIMNKDLISYFKGFSFLGDWIRRFTILNSAVRTVRRIRLKYRGSYCMPFGKGMLSLYLVNYGVWMIKSNWHRFTFCGSDLFRLRPSHPRYSSIGEPCLDGKCAPALAKHGNTTPSDPHHQT